MSRVHSTKSRSSACNCGRLASRCGWMPRRRYGLRLPRVRTMGVFLAIGLISALGGEAQKQKPPEGYTLVWSDEFNGKDGSLPEATKWAYDIGGGGGGSA